MYMYMQQRSKIYFLLVLGVVAVLLPATTKAATTIGNNVTVGGLTTLTGGFISSASSTISSGGLHVRGALNASSTLQVAGATVLEGTVTLNSTLSSSIIPTTADTYNLGSYTASFANLFASSTVYSASSTVFNAISTSSVYVKSGTTNRGGQLILKAYNGTCYAVYIGLFNDGALGVTSTALSTCY